MPYVVGSYDSDLNVLKTIANTLDSGLGGAGDKSAPAAVSVTTSATLLLAAGGALKGAVLYNNGSVTLYVGSTSGVTAANGLPVPAGSSVEDAGSTDAWYGIVETGTTDVRVMGVA